jgi:hypothetical protein
LGEPAGIVVLIERPETELVVRSIDLATGETPCIIECVTDFAHQLTVFSRRGGGGSVAQRIVLINRL